MAASLSLLPPPEHAGLDHAETWTSLRTADRQEFR